MTVTPETDEKMPEEVLFMSRLELYRELYEYEKDCNEKMLGMIESVPAASRGDARFQQAVSIAGHSVASRKKWLSRIKGETLPEEEKWAAQWYDEKCSFTALGPRFDDTARQWADYLASLEEAQLAQKFEFTEGEEHLSLPIEVQVIHLFGHASYHRGQVAVLVDQLGGEVPLIDYEDWWCANRREPEAVGA